MLKGLRKNMHKKANHLPENRNDNIKRDESERCHGCEGYGHRVAECPTKLKNEGKKLYHIIPPLVIVIRKRDPIPH